MSGKENNSVNIPFISIIHTFSIMSSITLLTIQHQGMKSALRLQKLMTTCPLPTTSLWQAAKKPLLKLSMPFFNSQLCFHLKRQAKTNYSSLRSTMGINSLPTSIIIRQECFTIPSSIENTTFKIQAWALLLRLHNSQMCQPASQLCPAESQLCFSSSGWALSQLYMGLCCCRKW